MPGPCSLLVNTALKPVQAPAHLLPGRQRPWQDISRAYLLQQQDASSTWTLAARDPPGIEWRYARQEVKQVRTAAPQMVWGAPVATLAQQGWLLPAAATRGASSLRQASVL